MVKCGFQEECLTEWHRKTKSKDMERMYPKPVKTVIAIISYKMKLQIKNDYRNSIAKKISHAHVHS